MGRSRTTQSSQKSTPHDGKIMHLLPRIKGRRNRDEYRKVGDALGMTPGDRGLDDVDDVAVTKDNALPSAPPENSCCF